jgi:hypothetical protein
MFPLRILAAATIVCAVAVNLLWVTSIGFALVKLVKFALSFA